jgi:hypothetical protein
MRTVSEIDMPSRMVSSSRRAVRSSSRWNRIGLADAFDQVEHIGAFLVAHGIAEDAPEQTDVIPQPRIFRKRGGLMNIGVFGAIGAAIGLGRHGLGRHGWLLQKLPGMSGVCNFFTAAQDEDRGGAHARRAKRLHPTLSVMAGFVPAIHAFLPAKNVDARDQPVHDG